MNLIDILRQFWDKGVIRVSPGALGMYVLYPPRPYEKHELEEAVSQTIGVKWDGEWMVEDKEE